MTANNILNKENLFNAPSTTGASFIKSTVVENDNNGSKQYDIDNNSKNSAASRKRPPTTPLTPSLATQNVIKKNKFNENELTKKNLRDILKKNSIVPPEEEGQSQGTSSLNRPLSRIAEDVDAIGLKDRNVFVSGNSKYNAIVVSDDEKEAEEEQDDDNDFEQGGSPRRRRNKQLTSRGYGHDNSSKDYPSLRKIHQMHLASSSRPGSSGNDSIASDVSVGKFRTTMKEAMNDIKLSSSLNEQTKQSPQQHQHSLYQHYDQKQSLKALQRNVNTHDDTLSSLEDSYAPNFSREKIDFHSSVPVSRSSDGSRGSNVNNSRNSNGKEKRKSTESQDREFFNSSSLINDVSTQYSLGYLQFDSFSKEIDYEMAKINSEIDKLMMKKLIREKSQLIDFLTLERMFERQQ